jgi:polyhydroxybutyrate depolymerase
MEALTGLSAAADRHGCHVVYPDGITGQWDVARRDAPAADPRTDDVAFVATLLESLAADQPLDPRRIYAVGMSNGASFSHRLACDLPGRLAAIASVAGTISRTLITDAHASPIPVMHVHGTADRFMPFDGSPDAPRGPASVAETAAFWRTVNGHGPFAVSVTTVGEVREEVSRDDSTGSEVRVVVVDGGGHTWPGGPQYLPEKVVGRTSQAFDATAGIMAFFRRHALPPATATRAARRETATCASL